MVKKISCQVPRQLHSFRDRSMCSGLATKQGQGEANLDPVANTMWNFFSFKSVGVSVNILLLCFSFPLELSRFVL